MPKAMEWLHSNNEPATPAAIIVPDESKGNETYGAKAQEEVAPVIEKVTIEMTAHGDCWLEVNADGKIIFEGMLRAKDVKAFEANDKLIVKYGNVGVMEVKVNGEPVSMQGEQGVAIKTYSK